MRLRRWGNFLACLTLVIALLAPARASAAESGPRLRSAEPLVITVWMWFAERFGLPRSPALRGIAIRSGLDPEGLERGSDTDPNGGQGATPGSTPTSASTTGQDLDRGWGIDPMGGGEGG